MRVGIFFATLVTTVAILASSAGAIVYVNRVPNPNPPYYTIQPLTISSNTTWNADTYVIEATVTVDSGVTLGIASGSIVQVANNLGIYVNGTLTADNVEFTHLSSGNWRGIYLSPASGASILNNCTISYAGALHLIYVHSGDRDASLYVDSCAPQITGCTISNSSTNGIELWSSTATIQNTTFTNMGGSNYPMVFDTTDTFPVMSGNSTSGTGYNGIALPSGSMAVSGSWNLPGSNFPYLMRGQLTVNDGVTLTVAAGNTVKSNGDPIHVYGTLSAVGTSELPIAFSSRAASPAAGDWKGIYLGPNAGTSAMSHVTINYAGALHLIYVHSGDRDASLYLDGISPPLTNLSILNSATNGLELYGASPAITNGNIQGCGRSGLRAENGSRPTINTATINNNGSDGYFAVSIDSGSVPDPTGVTFSGNTKQGIEVRGGTLSASGTWKNWSSNAPYAVTGNMTVAAGVILTIAPTTTVKLWNTYLYVYGTLTANSTSGRITFTSLANDTVGGDTNGDGSVSSPAAGNWRGIYLSPASGASILNNCTISYAGALHLIYVHSGDRDTSLYVDSCAPQITGCTISNSSTNGIELYAASPSISNSRFDSCGGTQLKATAASQPTVSGSQFIGVNANYGFTTDSTTLTLNAHNNYWGATNGPYDPSDDRASGGWYNLGGGVRVSDRIDYAQWDAGVNLTLTFNRVGGGGGTVLLDPPGTTSVDNITVNYGSGSAVRLTATGDANSLFSGWSQDCSGSGACDLTMDSGKSVTTTFTFVKPARILSPQQSFDTLAAAYAAAGNGSLIQLRDYVFTEPTVLFNRPVNVTVIGGYDKTFNTHGGVSIINGLALGLGSSILEGLVIK